MGKPAPAGNESGARRPTSAVKPSGVLLKHCSGRGSEDLVADLATFAACSYRKSLPQIDALGALASPCLQSCSQSQALQLSLKLIASAQAVCRGVTRKRGRTPRRLEGIPKLQAPHPH